MSEQMTLAVRAAKAQVCELAASFAVKGWLPATSGNLSVRVSGSTDFCVTRSGADKTRLTPDEVLWVDAEGKPREDTGHRPSAETVVHQHLYADTGCGCVVHVHTMYNNLASAVYFEKDQPDGPGVPLAGHELLKALDHWEEDARITVPIVENFADLERLGRAVRAAIRPGVPGVLVHNHGIYAFGKTSDAARRYLEAFEFLFEFDIRMVDLRRTR